MPTDSRNSPLARTIAVPPPNQQLCSARSCASRIDSTSATCWWCSRLNKEHPVAVGVRQVLDERLLVIREGFLVEVSPTAFVEVECLRLGDGGAGVGLPCQRAEAGVVADRDRRRLCCWSVEDRDDESKSECDCNVDVGADRDRGV